MKFKALMAIVVCAVIDTCSIAAVGSSHSTHVVLPDPVVRYGQLANGVRYEIVRSAIPAGASSLRLRMAVGSLNEDEDQRGLAHLLEHMAFNGSARIAEGDLVPLLQRHGMAFGSDANAYTTPEQTVYSLDLPRSDSESIDTALMVFREVASNLTLADDAIERERGVVAAEARQGDTPELSATVAQMRFLFPEARFPDRLPIGNSDVVARAPSGRIRDFYREWYRPHSTLITFVGDANPALVRAAIERHFADWLQPEAEVAMPNVGKVGKRAPSVRYEYQAGVQGNVKVASLRQVQDVTDTPESRFSEQLLLIANLAMNERLMHRLKDGDTPVSSAEFGTNRVYSIADMEWINIGATPDAWPQALALAEQSLRQALTFGFSSQEVERQVSVLRADLASDVRRASTRTTVGFVFALKYADQLHRVFGDARDILARFDACRRRMTVDEVNAAFRQAWSDGPHVIVTTGARIEDGDARVREVLTRSALTPVGPPVDPPLQSFAYGQIGPRGHVVERTHDAATGITRVRFANNVRINIRYSETEADRERLQVSVGGKLIDPIQNKGWQEAFQATFLSGGLLAHDFEGLEQIRAGRPINLGSSTAPDGILLIGDTDEASLLYQLQLFCAYLIAPGFRSGPVKLFHESTLANFDSTFTTAAGVLGWESWRVLTGGNPKVTLPDKTELLGWTAQRLQSVMKPLLEHGSIEIGFVGSVPSNAVIDAVSKTFAALPERLAVAAHVLDEHVTMVRPTNEPVVLRHHGSTDQAMAAVYWPTGDDSDSRRNSVLSLTARILTQRLIDRVRERESLSYSPSAGNFASHLYKGFGYFAVSVDSPPAQTAHVLELVTEAVASMQNGISQEELERARGPAIEHFREATHENDFWLTPLSVLQSDPDRLRNSLSRVARYSGITTQDIVTAARQYLKVDAAVQVLVLPDP